MLLQTVEKTHVLVDTKTVRLTLGRGLHSLVYTDK